MKNTNEPAFINRQTAKELRKELNELVNQNYISYDPVTGEYEVQGRSMEIGLAMYVEMLK